jgi:hypothetical protein
MNLGPPLTYIHTPKASLSLVNLTKCFFCVMIESVSVHVAPSRIRFDATSAAVSEKRIFRFLHCYSAIIKNYGFVTVVY